MINESQLNAFMAVYERALELAVRTRPDKYTYPVSEVPAVVVRMRKAIAYGTASYDGLAFKWTCKELGIKHTRKAISAFLSSSHE